MYSLFFIAWRMTENEMYLPAAIVNWWNYVSSIHWSVYEMIRNTYSIILQALCVKLIIAYNTKSQFFCKRHEANE